MKVITMWQPWASLLACGAKQYETRSWATNYQGEIAIHAAAANPYKFIKGLDDETISVMMEKLRSAKLIPQRGDFRYLPCGVIVSTAELVRCIPTESFVHSGTKRELSETEFLLGDWTPERYAWEFRNMKILPEPIPAKGKQRIWNWEGNI